MTKKLLRYFILATALVGSSVAAHADRFYTMTLTSATTGSSGSIVVEIPNGLIFAPNTNYFGPANLGDGSMVAFYPTGPSNPFLLHGFEGTQTLGDMNTVFIESDLGTLIDFNIWSYDRIATGSNVCSACVGIYYAGIAPHTLRVTDNATGYSDTYDLTLVQTPEPGSLFLLAPGLLGFGSFVRRKMLRA